MVDAIDAVAAEVPVGERHTVRGGLETIEELLDHLDDQSLTIELLEEETDGPQRNVVFVKVAHPTRDQTAYYLDGGTSKE